MSNYRIKIKPVRIEARSQETFKEYVARLTGNFVRKLWQNQK